MNARHFSSAVEIRQDKDNMWYVYKGGVPVKNAKFVLRSVAEMWCKANFKVAVVDIIPHR